MRLSHFSWHGCNHFTNLTYTLPANRPRLIGNPMHVPPAEGYGQWGTVLSTNPYVKVTAEIIRVTSGGNALYILNDPDARMNYSDAINREAQTIIVNHVNKVINDVLLIYQLRFE